MSRRLTTEEFIAKAHGVHGNRYGYSQVAYTNTRGKVVIICKEHGEFYQSPVDHLSGRGCKKCHVTSYDAVSFAVEAEKVHGDKYDYSLVEYKDSKTPVTILCREHGPFTQLPDTHIHRKRGCQACRPKMVHDTQSFLDKAQDVHGATYDYTKVRYAGSAKNVIITCRKHGDFKQTPTTHLTEGGGCPKCAKYGFNPVDPAVLYVYLMRSASNNASFVGFGITAHFETRDESHRLQASRSGFTLTLVACKEFKVGESARTVERLIKESVRCVDTGIRGFRTEAANESSLPDILRILNAA